MVKIDESSKLCRADEVGEICLYAHSTGNAYWGLEGKSASTFKLDPIGEDSRHLGAVQYTRTGLIGFLGPVEFHLFDFEHNLFSSGRLGIRRWHKNRFYARWRTLSSSRRHHRDSTRSGANEVRL